MEKQDFKTGELKYIDPHRLIKDQEDDSLSQFFLILAVIFNDLKGIVLFEKLVKDSYREAPLDELTSHAGEYAGIFTQTHKIFVGNIREFLKFLEEKEDILSSIEFKNLLLRTSKDTQNRWKDIIAVIFDNKTENSEFVNYLRRVRNNVSFHYNQSDVNLKKAFCNFFDNKERIIRNNSAYYAVGETMESTRFFYADAAVEEYLRSGTGKGDGFDMKYKERISRMIFDMNFAISRLLKEYLKNRPK
jgi:hypothetical protein